jgi:hypothetical protein
MNNVFIFGTGGVADILVKEYLDLEKNTILGYINTITKDEKTKNGYPVIGLSEIEQYDFDFILLASRQHDIMYRQCIEKGIPEQKIVGIVQEGTLKLIQDDVNKCIKKSFHIDIDNLFKKQLSVFTISTLSFENELYFNDDLNIFESNDAVDNQRCMTLKALAQEIKYNNVQGNVAELGVYKGDFSKIINSLFPDKILYLLDTFEGFDQSDIAFEKNENLSSATITTTFKDTSVDLVLQKMPFKENCRIIKGFFPESLQYIDNDIGGGKE